MKKMLAIAALLAMMASMKAQDCDVLVAPAFNYRASMMDSAPAAQKAWLCAKAQVAFYESDTLPSGARLYTLDTLQFYSRYQLPDTFVVDLATLSYYRYAFMKLQYYYQEDPNKVLCFYTPDSAHRYLVLRSLNDIYNRASAIAEPWME